MVYHISACSWRFPQRHISWDKIYSSVHERVLVRRSTTRCLVRVDHSHYIQFVHVATCLKGAREVPRQVPNQGAISLSSFSSTTHMHPGKQASKAYEYGVPRHKTQLLLAGRRRVVDSASAISLCHPFFILFLPLLYKPLLRVLETLESFPSGFWRIEAPSLGTNSLGPKNEPPLCAYGLCLHARAKRTERTGKTCLTVRLAPDVP